MLPSDDNCIDDDGIPFMPFFEGDDGDDRPFAPAAEDYPIGCEVELKDIEVAKIAQTPANWEDFMDRIFAVHRRRVIVRRHLGDYSFVVCHDEEGFEVVGMTLYRACLSEPKVKTTKYYSTLAGAEMSKRAIEMMDDDDLREEIKRRMTLPLAPGAASIAFELGAAASPVSLSADTDDGDGRGGVSNNINVVRRRSKFAIAMKFGTRELERHNVEKAIRYYNLALAEAPEEEARVVSSRSVAYSYLHQTELALRDAYRAIELQPDNYVGYVRAGNILRGTKQFDEAKSFYKKALDKSPNDTKLQKLYADNCVAMLYALRTKKCPKLKVTHHDDYRRAVVIAAQHVAPNVILLAETTSLTAVPHSLRGTSGCGHCCRPFVKEEEVYSHITGLQSDLFRQLHTPVATVKCQYCGVPYCCDKCRTRAWAEHHWVECRARGRWRRGLREMDAYLKEYVGDEERELLDAVNDNSRTVVAACCQIAVRMLSRMSSCVWTLHDAVEMYNWLQVAPSVASRRSEVSGVLRKCFDFIKEGFSFEASSVLTYELFEKCYERAKTNAIGIFASAWEKISKKASDELLRRNTLLKKEEGRDEVLQRIAEAPAKGVPGSYVNVLCVFELHALTVMPCAPPAEEPQSSPTRARRHQLPQECVAPNVEIGTVIQSHACIYLRSSQTIERGAILRCKNPAALYSR